MGIVELLQIMLVEHINLTCSFDPAELGLLQAPCATIKVLVPLNPILDLADYSHHQPQDPCLLPTTLEPGSKRQATA